ncbi:LuxR C-terminal-related transcriptional regulator [Pseudoalteromonas sp. TB64]|uniref:helix-turn-helix transcriptional regulator n=1 Tax=Pseudoalteromonas sp. TB64 TaxID=1938600 RepID=UPI0003F884D0|nr:LuxR C-terminal-related transcriptional regulator [Pseudoalteromonas sp. TB64]
MRQGIIDTYILEIKRSGLKCNIVAKISDIEFIRSNARECLVIIDDSIDYKAELKLFKLGYKGVIWIKDEHTCIELIVKTILNGGFWFDRITLSKLIISLPSMQYTAIKDNARTIEDNNFFGFTKRELQIIEQVLHGCTNREIATNKCISETTVKSHIKNIFSKADVKSRTSLVAKISSLHKTLQKDGYF